MQHHDNEKPGAGPPPSLDLDQAERFVEALTGSRSTPTTIQNFLEPEGASSSSEAQFHHGPVRTLWPEIERLQDDGHGIFDMVNQGDGRGRSAANVTGLNALFLDDDTGSLTLSALNLTPTVVTQSGRGIHVYYRLKPGERREDFTAAQKALAEVYGTDPSVSDLPRVMRLPGTWWLKDRSHPKLVTIIQADPSLRYSIAEIMEAHGRRLPAAVTLPPRNGATTVTSATIPLLDTIGRARAYLAAVPGVPEGSRGSTTFRLAAEMVKDFALSVEVAIPLISEWNKRNLPPLPDAEVVATVKNAERHGKHEVGAKLAPASEPTPQVVTVTQLPPVLVSKRLTIGRIKSPLTEQFVLGSFIPFGKSSVLYGPQSVGKSAWMAQLAFAFAAGAEQLWGLPLYPGGGPVLIYTAEDTFEDWERKGAAILKGSGINVEKALERLFVIDKTEGVARLSEVITIRNATTSRRVAQPTEEADALVAAAKKIGA